MQNKLIVLQGLPASGKSTLAKQMAKADPKGTIIVSRDAFRHALGEYWVPSRERYVSCLETYAVRKGLKEGFNVVVDATNLNEEIVEKWKDTAAEANAEIEFIKLSTPLQICLERDNNPDREHKVGEDVIKSFYNRYKDQLS